MLEILLLDKFTNDRFLKFSSPVKSVILELLKSNCVIWLSAPANIVIVLVVFGAILFLVIYNNHYQQVDIIYWISGVHPII